MASVYLKLVRRSHRFLRSGLMRRVPLIARVLKPLFQREYWIASPHRMALGLSIGLFCAFSMMVIPVQMIVAAAACLWFRANLPISLGACWITNPLTIPPLAYFAVIVGEKISLLGIDLGDEKLSILGLEVHYGHFMVGCVTLAVVLSLLAYPIFRFTLYCMPKRKR